MAEWIGRSISKVTIQKLIGRGGMADVYLGQHDTLNRPVAVKILHGHLIEDSTLMARFRSEAQAAANLRHPHILQIYDFDLVDDHPYIVMEWIEGPTLADHLERLRETGQSMPATTMARLVGKIASALDYAHQRNIVHRDVKPSNVILRRDAGPLDPGQPLPDDAEPILADFGVARITNTTVRTASGSIVGTPAYMSPEQVSGQTVDARSDVYSLGIMTYEMIAGRLPFEADEDTVAATLVKHITEAPPPLPEAPPAVQATVLKALAKDRADRHQSAGALAFELKQACGLPVTEAERQAYEQSATLILGEGPAEDPARPHATPTTQFGPAGTAPRATWWRWLAVAVVAAIIIAVAAIIIGSLFGDDDPAAGDAAVIPDTHFGAVRFAHDDTQIDRIAVEVDGLAPPPEAMQYEVWLLGSETRESAGILTLDDDGHGALIYVDEDGQNLLADFGRFEITVEPMPDSNPLPTGDVAYSGAVPPGPLAHVRHLLSGFGRTPAGNGLVIGLMEHTAQLAALSDDLAAAQDEGDLDALHQHAEALVNLIEGSGGDNYGDLDGDGDTTDPGDGYGLLPGTQGSGYIQTAIEHARYAAGSEGATAYIIEHKDRLEAAAQNLGGWAAELRDVGLAILASDDTGETAELVPPARDLIDLFQHGQDANDDGHIEAIPGEGGAQTVLHHALRMGDMVVLEGANRLPAPVEENPDPNVFPEGDN